MTEAAPIENFLIENFWRFSQLMFFPPFLKKHKYAHPYNTHISILCQFFF